VLVVLLETPPPQVQARTQARADKEFTLMLAQGGMGHMMQQQLAPVLKEIYARALAAEQEAAEAAAGGGTSGGPASRQMRVAIDKRDRAAFDAGFQAVDTTGEDPADEVVQRKKACQ
jgi:hypothetical protein